MQSTKKCAQCEEDLSGEGLWGLCTRCLYNESIEANAEESVEKPRFLGNYELQEVIGRGGMGVVYKAVQRYPRRTVALKMILDSELASEVSRRRFTLEAEIAAKLDHPNIVPIYDIGEADGQQFLSMKLVLGETLRKKLDRGDFTFSAAAGSGRSASRERATAAICLMVDVARAVQHAHENGILHRDLKPGNIIVDAGGKPHLTDFGLAKLLEPDAGESRASRATLSGATMGTPSYMSPEQAQGRRLSEASDIYSLGSILYEILTGNPPFRAGTPLETLRLVVEEPSIRPSAENPRVDKDLDTICTKCLEKNPRQRYLTAAAFADDLEHWLKQEPISARPIGPGMRATRWVLRNRLGTALIVTLCIGLAVALVLLQQTLARQKQLDLHRANNILAMSTELEEIWKDPEKRFILIPSSVLANLAELPPREHDALTARLAFGQTINHEPFGQAMQYAPFLNLLESRIAKTLGRPVAVDLRLYKSEAEALRDGTRGKLAVQRMEPVLYVLANSSNNTCIALAQERSSKAAVIFASRESGITNLSQIAGRRVHFGQRHSTVTFWAKVHLARNGIRARHLQSCSYIDEQPEPIDPTSPSKLGADRDPHLQATKRLIAEISDGRADVGVAPRRQFELHRFKKRGLVELHAFPIPSDLHVAASTLEPELRHAFQQSLTSFKSPEDVKVLRGLSENVVIRGFDPVRDEDFDGIRSALIEEIAEFDGRRE